MYKFQIANIIKAERPEYEDKDNKHWKTIEEAETAEDLLCYISDWLNDECCQYDITTHWTRIIKDNVVMQSGLKL